MDDTLHELTHKTRNDCQVLFFVGGSEGSGEVSLSAPGKLASFLFSLLLLNRNKFTNRLIHTALKNCEGTTGCEYGSTAFFFNEGSLQVQFLNCHKRNDVQKNERKEWPCMSTRLDKHTTLLIFIEEMRSWRLICVDSENTLRPGCPDEEDDDACNLIDRKNRK